MKNKMTKKRKIAVVTGTRAEYGVLKPLLREIKKSKNLELELMVTGMHLLESFGFTAKQIKKDGFKLSDKIKMYKEKKQGPGYYGEALARGIKNFTKSFLRQRPDFLVVVGDRLEPLAAVLASSPLKIPIIHVHGGGKTDSGHIDENIRHSITRFSHIHLALSEKARKRLIRWGEEPWRIYNVGALNLDSILGERKMKKEILFKKFNLDPKQKLILCIFHSVHLEAEKAKKQAQEVFEAIKEMKIQTIIIYPNNDDGGEDIISEIKKIQKLPFVKTFLSLKHKDYVNFLKNTDLLMGNSSSGIIEAPALKLPVVNIGSRNKGRDHADNVLFVDLDKKKIIRAVKKAVFDKSFRQKIKKCKNPFGQGRASEKIVKILTKIKKDKKLLQKKITY